MTGYSDISNIPSSLQKRDSMESGQKRLYSLDQVQFYAQSLDSIKTLDKPTLVDVHRNIQGKNYTDPEVFSIIAKSILKKHF